jgi:2-hydroxy-3-keto-5-methylthiopentenyl-1-phosphate phosphatase
MAKTTFEKIKNQLVENSVLSVVQGGNKKFYKITENYQKKKFQQIERISHENYQNLQHQIKRIKDNFYHKDVNEKVITYVQLLKNLLYTDNGFTFLDSVKNSKRILYKDEHLLIQEMISETFEIIINDKDYELIYPMVMKNIGLNISITSQM